MRRALAIVLSLGLAGVAGAQPAGSAAGSAEVGSAETGSAGSAETAPIPADELPPPHRYDDVPRLSEGLYNGKKLPMPEVHLSRPEREPDRRPFYVGAALVVLAAGLWWNRRQRERFEREDERDDDEEST